MDLCHSIESVSLCHIVAYMYRRVNLVKSRRKDCCGFFSDCVCCGINFILHCYVGVLCGCFCQKKNETAATETVPPAGGQTQLPYYDGVVLRQPALDQN